MKRGVLDLVALGPLCALLWFVFGWPHPGAAADLVGSADPSHSQIVAGVGLLAWCLVGVLGVVFAIAVVRSSGPWARTVFVLAVGTTLLITGIVVHAQRGYEMCCGSTQAAQHALMGAP